MENHILEMQKITKDFPGVRALDDVNFSVERGKIHAIVGENGAGKSTLMKILSGVYPIGTFEGKILINGVEKEFGKIKDSEKAGITIIYQELALVNQLSVTENLFLGNEIASRSIVNWSKAHIEAEKALQEVGLELNPETKIYDLGVGQQQLVEIAKAIAKHTDILILDEPTASLTRAEVENLFQILRRLKSKGVTCIYISHKLYEVFEIADTITVLRDGKSVGTRKASDVTQHDLITMMVGRELNKMFPREEHQAGEIVLEVKNWSVYDPEIPDRKIVDDVSFVVKRGEILGLS
jgi:ABC-type sugar transport system ATPase subunit